LLTRDRSGGAALAGIDHDEQLHDVIVDLAAATLHNEDILVADRRLDLNRRLAIACLLTPPSARDIAFAGRVDTD
jgi:hypothetical protein